MGRKVVRCLSRKVGLTVYVYLVLWTLIILTCSTHLILALCLVTLTLQYSLYNCGVLLWSLIIPLVTILVTGLVVKDWFQYKW